MKDNETILEVKKMNKKFGPTIALDQVSITLRKGEVLGLIGENGSGKSTVTSIIAGMQKADSGEMIFADEKWEPHSMIDSLKKGVGMIVQESGTVPGISVAENIFLGESSQFRNKFGLVSKKKMLLKAKEVLLSIGVDYIDPKMITGCVDLQDRKIIEIAKIVSKNPEVLIVDETTTALSQKGREIIYKIIEKMKSESKSVIFISHDLEEIIKVCDRLTVLRDGKIIVSFDKEEFDEEIIKTSMIGRELKGDYYRTDYDNSHSAEVILEIKNANKGNELKDLNLSLHKGEILGVGGLSHCGMHTLGKVLFGSESLDTGEVIANGRLIKSEKDAIAEKIGYVAKDRDIESLALNSSIRDNISVGGLDRFSIKNFLILPNRERKYVDEQINNLNIKCQGREQFVSFLSGGNKQKVVFGKWIGRESEILILDCPTRGVDIGVKQAMYHLMNRMKKENKAIIIISEELAELIGMCDKILVMKDGQIKKEFDRSKELSEADIINHMV